MTRAQREGVAVLRRVLTRLRWDDQGGYVGYQGHGRWDFVSTGLPQTTPRELNALMRLAGITPDVIVPKGSCETCAFAVKVHGTWQERGWGAAVL